MPIESGDTLDSQDSFYLSDVSPADKPWDKHRTAASQVGNLYAETDLLRYSQRIADCSRSLRFALETSEVGEVKLKLRAARFCRVRHCPVCQWRRSLMWRARFFKALPKIMKAYPSHRFIFLTLTLRNCEIKQLRKTVSYMHKAWITLTKRKAFPGLGWVKSAEVTRSADGEAHPHFHIIVMVKPSYFGYSYMKQSDWAELWRDCLNISYTPVVNVKAIKPSKKTVKLEEADDAVPEIDQEMFKALCETLKYAVKEDDLIADPKWLEELTKQLHKTRAVSVGGVFRQFFSEDEPEDLVHTDLSTDDEELLETAADIWFGWHEMVKRYKKE